MEESLEAEAVYRSSKLEFNEISSTLLEEVQIDTIEASFIRTQSPVRSYYHVKFMDGSVSIAYARHGRIRSRGWPNYTLSEQDLKIVDALDIDWICDLRSDFEVSKHPSPKIGKAINTNIPFMSQANPEEMLKVSHDMKAVYQAMILNSDKCSIILNELLKEDRETSLYHLCCRQ